MYKITERINAPTVQWYEPSEHELRNQRAAFIRNARAKVQSKPSLGSRLAAFLSDLIN